MIIRFDWCVCGALIELDPMFGEWLHVDIILDSPHAATLRGDPNYEHTIAPDTTSQR